jgi:hypothetical protein
MYGATMRQPQVCDDYKNSNGNVPTLYVWRILNYW